MVSFGQYPENLGEVELMGNRIICLEGDISRQEGIQAGAARASVLVTVRTSLRGTSWSAPDNSKDVLRAEKSLSDAPNWDHPNSL